LVVNLVSQVADTLADAVEVLVEFFAQEEDSLVLFVLLADLKAILNGIAAALGDHMSLDNV
jgi:Tfp pilus assembly PilM family ATPase